MKGIGLACRGRQPWQNDSEGSNCDLPLVVLQRGASSVYFASVESAIDIPPESNWINFGGPAARIKGSTYFKPLLQDPQSPIADSLMSMIALEEDTTKDVIRAVLAEQLGAAESPGSFEAPADLRVREWQALTSPADEHDPRDAFISRRVPFPSPAGDHALGAFADALVNLVSDVIVVDRLREIRVLRGFYRHTMDRIVAPDLGYKVDFLPAIEVFGEGVFIRIHEDALREWESLPLVQARVKPLRSRFGQSMYAKWVTEKVTPRLVLIHTLGHLLMRQMSFDAGYASSSLRERVFADASATSPLAGLLLYTAAGDSEGSLGGLARLGEAQHLVPVFARALASAQWCSLDPVCGESGSQGPDGLSLAACHACALASETSCVLGNVLLDRGLVIDPSHGFFSGVTAQLLSTQAESLA
jgi:hypothetical protein